VTTSSAFPRLRAVLAIALTVFVLAEVNFPHLTPLSQLALFALIGLVLAFLPRGADEGGPTADAELEETHAGSGDDERSAAEHQAPRPLRLVFFHLLPILASVVVFLYLVIQTEPMFESWWLDGRSLGDRAGAEHAADLALGGGGLLLILEAARRTVGWALPALSVVFLAYAALGPHLPDFLLPHRGYDLARITSQTFLHSQGVFGIALRVMFTYVVLFIVFGAVLEATGATGFLVDTSRRLFGRSTGGPAKVAVLSSGLMGSLSGSAVANTATTGTLTIPMMRSAGFSRSVAGGLEAAASSGGALVPPVMGAGAYMMLEIIEPPVTYLEILKAALIPAVLYYLSIFLMVHFRGRLLESPKDWPATSPTAAPTPKARDLPSEDEDSRARLPWEAVVFGLGLATLIGMLLARFTVFRAATVALAVVLAVSLASPRTRLDGRKLIGALRQAAGASMPLIAAAASVGVILGVVTLTGLGTRLPSLILPLAQESLFPALLVIMLSSLVLGMGLPSSVCYLLLATLVGPVLGRLGVVPLAAHLFIFYFGMMSMVTPPVALAAYAASGLAGSSFWSTSLAAFRFALAGFALPFLFVYRPQLLMLATDGGAASLVGISIATGLAVLGIVPLAAAVAGWLGRPLGPLARALLVLSAVLALVPGAGPVFGDARFSVWNLAGVALLVGVWGLGRRRQAPS